MATRTKSSTEKTAAIGRRLAEGAAAIPVPANYLHGGTSGSLLTIPRSILQYLRRNDTYMRRPSPFFHHRFVLTVCLAEPGSVVLDGMLFTLHPNEGILLFPYQSHYFMRFQNPSNIRWLFTTFEHTAPEEFEQLRNRPMVFSPVDMRRLERVTECNLASLKGDAHAANDLSLELALLLSGLLAHGRGKRARVRTPSRDQLPGSKIVQTIALHVCRHPERRFTVAEAARLVSLSPSRLRAKFRKTLGLSLGRFIRETRMSKACDLLHTSELNVTEIGRRCGYESVYAFSRAFSRSIRIPPREYRKKMKASQRIGRSHG